MAKKVFSEKLKRSFCVFLSAVMVLMLVISTGRAFAISPSPAKTAEIKAYYHAFDACISQMYQPTNEDLNGHKNIFSYIPKDVAPLVERGVGTETSDSKIKCSEGNNELFEKAKDIFGVTLNELVCDYRNTSTGNPGGLYTVKNSNSDCLPALNSGTKHYFSTKSVDERRQYFQELVESKTGLTDLTTLTPLETYYLYTDAFKSMCATDGSKAYLDDPSAHTYQIMIYDTSTKQFVPAGFSGDNKNKQSYMIGSNQWMKCSDIASELDKNGSVYSAVAATLQTELSNGTSAQELGVITEETVARKSDTGNDDSCYNGAGALGWVLCPIISTTSNLLSSIYGTIEREYLQIDAINLFNRRNDGGMVGDPIDSNQSDESSVHILWSAFRDIANIAFVILLLFVIFSQVTGRGIDNYGIKKSLPRLIVAAILVNLSYYICMLAVDLSNVIGVGIKDIFGDLTTQISINAPTSTDPSGIQNGIVMGSLLAIGFIVLLVSPGLILTLALVLVSMAISVLFLWIILIVRQAGIVLLVGISPLAFVAYILPNTERLFKRWLDIAKSLLLLYPICTFVIGAGTLAGRMFANMNASGESVGLTLAAMIVPVIPYFFIPSLLRGSLKGLGNLGATISRLGRSVNQGTVGRFAKSDAAKRMRTSMNAWDAGGLRNRVSNTKFGKYTGLQRSSAQKIAAREKMKSDDRAAQALLQKERFARLERQNPNNVTPTAFEAQLTAALQNNNGEDQFDSILSEIERRFGNSKASDIRLDRLLPH